MRIRAALRSVLNALRPRAIDQRLEEEVAFHLDMAAEQNRRRGMPAEEARRAALVRFGGRDRWTEATRDAYRSRPLDELAGDVRFSVRVLRRHPGYAGSTALTMAIGIAATASIFSVADAFLFKPLPFADGDRIVMLADVQGDEPWLPASYLEFSDWKALSREAATVVAFVNNGVTYAASDIVDRVRINRVSEGYFRLLGVRPVLGRTFVADEHRDGAPPVVVVSQAFWETRLGARPGVIGEHLSLNGQRHTVVGVVRSGLELGRQPAVAWVPLEARPPWRDRGTHYLTVLAKRREGVTMAALQRDLDDVARRVREANETTHGIVAAPLRDRILGEGRRPLLMLLGSVALLLAIAIANVSGLLQARVASRTTELAVRTALGASRWRLVRQVATEAVLLALIGGVLGLALTVWITRGFVWLWPASLPRPFDIGVDGRVVAVALGLCVLGALMAAVLAAATQRAQASLQVRAGAGAPRRTRRVLVATQVAITAVLLVGAGLTMRSLVELLRRDLGFSAEGVLTANLSLPSSRYPEPERRRFYRELLDRVRALPAVEDAGAVLNLPLSGGMNGTFAIEGVTFPRDAEPASEKAIVTPEYFRTMRMRLVRGRWFDGRDHADAPRVAIINETMAQRYWPNGNPIGRRIRTLSDSTQWEEIVGVVADHRLEALDAGAGLVTYVPFAQFTTGGLAVAIRTAAPDAVTPALRGIVRSMDPTIPVFGIQPFERIIFVASHDRRVPAVLLGAFSLLALTLAGVGLYGLLAYSVQQRRHEMGVRMAIGARSGDVLRLVIGDGMRLVAVGAVVGLVAASGLSRLIRSLLYGVGPTDPMVYGLSAIAIALVALAACAVPARRAAGVDPVRALRSE